jgi:very-short-patch-repair endonuclease
VDFCCVERRRVVEVDGGHHLERRARDEARSAWLGELGLCVVRFSNTEVLQEMEAVLTEIQNRL